MMVKKRDTPLAPLDEVYRTDSDLGSIWVILTLHPEEQTATIYLKGTDLQWFRYPLAKLTRVEK
jgi:hypothetical protein